LSKTGSPNHRINPVAFLPYRAGRLAALFHPRHSTTPPLKAVECHRFQMKHSRPRRRPKGRRQGHFQPSCLPHNCHLHLIPAAGGLGQSIYPSMNSMSSNIPRLFLVQWVQSISISANRYLNLIPFMAPTGTVVAQIVNAIPLETGNRTLIYHRFRIRK